MEKRFNSKKYGKVTITVKYGRTFIEWISSVALTQEEQLTVQHQMGYHPAGYSYIKKTDKSWECYSSYD